MRTNLRLAFLLCFAATSGFAQSGLNGKWATARPENPLTDAQRRQSVQLEVTVEGGKSHGTLSLGGLGGTFYTFEDGSLSGNRLQFRTSSTAKTAEGTWTATTTWTVELVDENTATISRAPLEIVGNNVLDRISIIRGPQGAGAGKIEAVNASPARRVSPAAERGAGSIGGVVQDASRAVIPGVTVTATNLDTGTQSTTVTNEAGRYDFRDVTPGRYTMTASIPGFRSATISDLTIGETPLLQDFALEFSTTRASGNPPVESCSPNAIVWCSVLHRK